MRTRAEGALALGLTVVLGLGLWLFSGDTIAANPTGSTTAISFDAEAAARGQSLAASTGCLACHAVDGTSGTGPTWKGLAGASRPLVSGESVVADDAYLFASVVDPATQVVAGFDPVMPTTYSETLTEADINDLVEYIKSLG
ncbi:MAG: c-type cytochrome [Acidimicrobiia bacterium]